MGMGVLMVMIMLVVMLAGSHVTHLRKFG